MLTALPLIVGQKSCTFLQKEEIRVLVDITVFLHMRSVNSD